MAVNKLNLNKLVTILIILYFSKTSCIQFYNGFPEEEASGMGDNLISISDRFRSTLKYDQYALAMEEKIKALTKNVDELGLRMVSLLNDNANIQTRLDQIVEEKIDNRFPSSCYDLNECNSNIYNIMVPEFSNISFPAVCDLKTLDGGWTIIHRRQDGFENFYRNWSEYVEGFGRMNGEFFIGLEKLHALTSLAEPQELYIILEDFEGERRYARYGKFQVGSRNTDYMLTVGEYSGNAGDCFTQHSGHRFSTKDQDNDANTINCATKWKGAWWYASCYYSNLNGLYLAGKIPKSKGGVSWCSFRGPQYSLKFAQMMIRPKN